MNRIIQDLKMETETIEKSPRDTTLELENLGMFVVILASSAVSIEKPQPVWWESVSGPRGETHSSCPGSKFPTAPPMTAVDSCGRSFRDNVGTSAHCELPGLVCSPKHSRLNPMPHLKNYFPYKVGHGCCAAQLSQRQRHKSRLEFWRGRHTTDINWNCLNFMSLKMLRNHGCSFVLDRRESVCHKSCQSSAFHFARNVVSGI